MNKELIDTIRLMNEKPIAFNKHYVFLGAGINGALMLSQLVYWSDKTKNNGWIYKTSKEWTAETGLTRREQDTARSKLKALGFIEEHLHGVPAKVHFKVLENNLYKALIELAKSMNKSSKDDQNIDDESHAQIRQTSAQIRQTSAQIRQTSAQIRQTSAQIRQTNTENTTEITIENTIENTNNKKYIKKKKFSFRDELLKLGADQQLVDDFCLVREKKKAVDSLTAFKKFIGQQSKSGMNLNAVLELCIEKSWKGFEVSWLKNQNSLPFKNNQQHGFIDFTQYRDI